MHLTVEPKVIVIEVGDADRTVLVAETQHVLTAEVGVQGPPGGRGLPGDKGDPGELSENLDYPSLTALFENRLV